MWVGSASSVFSEKRFLDRVRFVSFLFAFGYAVILLRLFQLQIVRGDDFAHMSESNRTQVVFLRAPRGNFYDRNGKLLITNRPSWSLMYSTENNMKTPRLQVEARLAPYLEPFSNQWRHRLMKAYQSKQMVRLVEDVPNRVAFAMRELGELAPGARMQMEFRRAYPETFTESHLIGYLGEIDERELDDEFWEGRRQGDLIGKTGLEKILDSKIRGQDGGMVIEIDSAGRLKRVIRELPYQTGNAVYLTLDESVQKAAVDGLAATATQRGAAIAIDVRTGAILAWASAPNYNPTLLKDALTDPNRPLYDRVYRGSYAPGSLFKLVVALAGFEKGIIRTSELVNCVGYLMLPDRGGGERKFRCWKRHGPVDYWQAVAQSCDVYFYGLGLRVGSLSMSEMARQFGFGTQVQQIFPKGESFGNIPNALWKKQKGLGGWSQGDTYNMAIGQGFVTATPIQIAMFMMGLANRGHLYRPYVVDRITNIAGQVIEKGVVTPWRNISLNESTWTQVLDSLRLVVTEGTAKSCDIPWLDVRGKTGTAQNPHGEDHAWFGCFAGYPGEPPSIAVCVFVENGGHGGVVSVPIARKMIEAALPERKAA